MANVEQSLAKREKERERENIIQPGQELRPNVFQSDTQARLVKAHLHSTHTHTHTHYYL